MTLRQSLPLASLLAAACVLLLIATPASAERSYLCQITGAGENSTSSTECDKSNPGAPGAPSEGIFNGLTDLSVDNADNLWFADSADSVVNKFDPSGNFLAQATGAGAWEGSTFIEAAAWSTVANRLFVGDAGPDIIWGLEPDGSYSGTELNPGLGGCCYFSLAADNSATPTGGDIYVYASGNNTVTRTKANGEEAPFSASASYIDGNHLTGAPSGAFSAPETRGGGVTIDSSGKLYVVDGDVVDEFAPSGTFIQSFTGVGAPGGFSGRLGAVAVDPTNADLLVVVVSDAEGSPNVIDEFSGAGEFLGQLTGPSPSEPFGFGHAFFVEKLTGIVVDSSGHLYVADRGPLAIDKFGPGRGPLALINYAEPSQVTHDTVAVNAEADPNGGGGLTDCHFEYGTDTSFGLGSKPCLDSGEEEVGTLARPIASAADIHADLTGLHGDTPYRYRIVLTDANGTQTGYSPTVEALPAVTDLQTTPATDITNVSATLRGSFTAEAGTETTYFFEYGTSSNFGHKSIEVVVPGTAAGSQDVGTPIAGLVPNTTYHYRIVAKDKYGTTLGARRRNLHHLPAADHRSLLLLRRHRQLGRPPRQDQPPGLRHHLPLRIRHHHRLRSERPVPAGHRFRHDRAGSRVELEGLQRRHLPLPRRRRQANGAPSPPKTRHSTSSLPTVPTPPSASRPAPPTSPIAAPTSSSRPQTPTAPCSSPAAPTPGGPPAPPVSPTPAASARSPAPTPINTVGDLYVATRTEAGWVSRYIGLPGNQAGCMGGPPTSPGDYASMQTRLADQHRPR